MRHVVATRHCLQITSLFAARAAINFVHYKVKTVKTNFYNSFVVAIIATLLTSTLAIADYRDYNYKAWNSGWKGSPNRSSVRSSRTYARSTPSVVKTEAAPAKVAQAPSENRTFSYDPAQDAKQAAPCHSAAKSAPETAAKAAEKSTTKSAEKPKATSTRSFSYEPDMAPARVSAPRYYGRSGGGSSGNGGFSYDRAMRAKGY